MTAPRSVVPPRLPLRRALSAALLIGVAQHAALAHGAATETGIEDKIQAEVQKGDAAKAVELAEAAVARAPQDAALRVDLGHAYLHAGRFESAAGALRDALSQGNTSNRVILSLALAQIACGQNREALVTLDRGGNIAPADLGLALALAGDGGRGIAVLTNAVRDGAASPNLRQNLAYAYALDGRWADATLTAGFDLPPDQVNSRLQQWAQSMAPGGERMRIARLLNVPLIEDAGMPATLALMGPRLDAAPAPAVAAAASTPPPVIAVAAVAADPIPVAAPVAAPVVHMAAAPEQASVRDLSVRAQGASPRSEHFVQLAAYHNRHDAERGRVMLAKRHALLRGHGLMITEARIRGRSYWRVVMAGFDGSTASSMCSSLRRHGAECFAYSARPARETPAMALADRP